MKTLTLNKFRTKAISVIRQSKNLIYPDALILMYHRVAEIDNDPWSLTVTPKNFSEHLEIIRKLGNPVHLSLLRRRINDNKSVKRYIVLTFDDGYADNLYNAKPLLEKYDIPATVFVTSSAINKRREFWWDELDRLIFQPLNLPSHLQLHVNGESFQWLLSDKGHYSQDRILCRNLSNINKSQKVNTSTDDRRSLHHEIYHILKYLPSFERDQVLGELRLLTNSDCRTKNNYPSLTSDDLVLLETGGLIEIGAHTVSHPFLSELDIHSQKDEIHNSKHYLENILDHPVNSFAYPHGSYNSDTIAIVKEAGFTCACSTLFGRVKRHSNIFLLPRFKVNNCNSNTFTKKYLMIP